MTRRVAGSGQVSFTQTLMSVEIFALDNLRPPGRARTDSSAGGRRRVPYRPRTSAIQKDQPARGLGRIASSYHSAYAATGLDLNHAKGQNHGAKFPRL
jgi:hypothetical protein